ncbi:hypothetical protein [Vibrio ziniensis]|uniref:Uncharacterized protein n=1 Tax=Vibrio ziniensis TaxID=2711221 RepID=A0A6G7CED2_9VIBR|nr:hypothetical protein [Vibrio ziniensis]QIH40467.1 hypothetical protein G5S32_07125 [Vibrio ziniensis]
MAAEKLTKHRLAQIVVTLTLLLIAFFWRTITYREVSTVICNPQPNCSVFVNNQKITVTKDDKQIGVFDIYPIPSSWEIKYDGEVTRDEQHVVLFPNSNNVQTSTSLFINDSIKIQIVN